MSLLSSSFKLSRSSGLYTRNIVKMWHWKSKIWSSHTFVDEESSLWDFMQQWTVYIL